jgi:two-component system response regulator RstA
MLPEKTASTTILIIEDNRYTQRLLMKQLTFHGFSVTAKDDGTSGLEWLREHQADIVVLDVILPDSDGVEICRTICQQHPAMRVMLLSALGTDSPDRARGIEAGAKDFMAKPYQIEELVAHLRALL